MIDSADLQLEQADRGPQPYRLALVLNELAANPSLERRYFLKRKYYGLLYNAGPNTFQGRNP